MSLSFSSPRTSQASRKTAPESVASSKNLFQATDSTEYEDYYGGDKIIRGSDGSIYELLDAEKRPPVNLFDQIVDEVESKLVQPFLPMS